MTTIVIDIPWIPSPKCSPNGGTPGRTMVRHRKAGVLPATMAIRSHLAKFPMEPMAGDLRLVIEVHWPVGRKPQDPTNIPEQYKYVIDVFQNEGVIVNDRDLRAPEVRQLFRCDGQGLTRITIQVVE